MYALMSSFFFSSGGSRELGGCVRTTLDDKTRLRQINKYIMFRNCVLMRYTYYQQAGTCHGSTHHVWRGQSVELDPCGISWQ